MISLNKYPNVSKIYSIMFDTLHSIILIIFFLFRKGTFSNTLKIYPFQWRTFQRHKMIFFSSETQRDIFERIFEISVKESKSNSLCLKLIKGDFLSWFLATTKEVLKASNSAFERFCFVISFFEIDFQHTVQNSTSFFAFLVI